MLAADVRRGEWGSKFPTDLVRDFHPRAGVVGDRERGDAAARADAVRAILWERHFNYHGVPGPCGMGCDCTGYRRPVGVTDADFDAALGEGRR